MPNFYIIIPSRQATEELRKASLSNAPRTLPLSRLVLEFKEEAVVPSKFKRYSHAAILKRLALEEKVLASGKAALPWIRASVTAAALYFLS